MSLIPSTRSIPADLSTSSLGCAVKSNHSQSSAIKGPGVVPEDVVFDVDDWAAAQDLDIDFFSSVAPQTLGAALSADGPELSLIPSITAALSPVPTTRSISTGPLLRSSSSHFSDMKLQGTCRLRGVSLQKLLKYPGCMLQSSVTNSYRHSREVEVLDAFLSHSWQAPAFAKHLMLCLEYRWKPSVLVGLAAAVLGTLACPLQLATEVQYYIALAVGCGLVALLFTMLVWPCRQMMFLDKACIDQVDAEAKSDGIQSIGYFLSRSRRVIVLWDASYYSRLWCIVEFAASLKLSRTNTNMPEISMRPLGHATQTLLSLLVNTSLVVLKTLADMAEPSDSPMSAKQFAGIFFGLMLIAVATDGSIRAQVKSFRDLEGQLRTFRIKDAKSSCCSNGHVDPLSKEAIPCDRDVLISSVDIWFGSAGSFEDYVQATLRQHVSMKVMMPYRYMLFSATPFVLSGLGGFIWLARSGQSLDGLVLLTSMIYQTTVGLPLVWLIIFKVHEVLLWNPGTRSMRMAARLLRGALIGTGASLVAMCSNVVEFYTEEAWGSEAWGTLLLFLTLGGLTFVGFRHR